MIQHGYLSHKQKELIASKLNSYRNNGSDVDSIDELLDQLRFSQHILDTNGNGMSKAKRETLKQIIEIVFNECSSDIDAEKIANKILNVSFQPKS
ncbi:MAG: hypothetical protein MUP98_07210 [Candidatus Aminicenantes bacterium]|nr:hypothetical protein [Candidatus Aminicenantes bacterium]